VYFATHSANSFVGCFVVGDMFSQFGAKRFMETAQSVGYFDFKSRAGLKGEFRKGPMTEAMDSLNRRTIKLNNASLSLRYRLRRSR